MPHACPFLTRRRPHFSSLALHWSPVLDAVFAEVAGSCGTGPVYLHGPGPGSYRELRSAWRPSTRGTCSVPEMRALGDGLTRPSPKPCWMPCDPQIQEFGRLIADLRATAPPTPAPAAAGPHRPQAWQQLAAATVQRTRGLLPATVEILSGRPGPGCSSSPAFPGDESDRARQRRPATAEAGLTEFPTLNAMT